MGRLLKQKLSFSVQIERVAVHLAQTSPSTKQKANFYPFLLERCRRECACWIGNGQLFWTVCFWLVLLLFWLNAFCIAGEPLLCVMLCHAGLVLRTWSHFVQSLRHSKWITRCRCCHHVLAKRIANPILFPEPGPELQINQWEHTIHNILRREIAWQK